MIKPCGTPEVDCVYATLRMSGRYADNNQDDVRVYLILVSAAISLARGGPRSSGGMQVIQEHRR